MYTKFMNEAQFLWEPSKSIFKIFSSKIYNAFRLDINLGITKLFFKYSMLINDKKQEKHIIWYYKIKKIITKNGISRKIANTTTTILDEIL